MTKSNILIFGSSGNCGAATVKSLVEKHAAHVNVFAASRDPAKTKTPAGVHVVKGDQGQYESALEAIAEAKAEGVFVIPPGTSDRAQVASTAIRAAADSPSVKFILVLSVANADTPSIFGNQFLPAEQAARQSGKSFAIIRLPVFLDNNWGNKGSIVGEGHIYGPQGADAKGSAVAVSDVGEVAAAILAGKDKHANKTYTITSPAFSPNELAAAFTKALGKPVTYVQVPYDAAKQSFLGFGFLEWQVDGLFELYRMADEEKYAYPHGDFKAITGRDPLGPVEWTAVVAAGFQ